ncbi:MAG: IS5 family transposase [Candidatus Diapherotrites archaeon]
MYPVKLNTFYQSVERLCELSGVKNTNSNFSKKMYGNVKLAFLICYREKLNVAYRRFVEICEENNIKRMLFIKRIPHFTTLQKFVQRTPKALLEKMVRACRKLLNLKDVTGSVDGTGFSNTNPSHHYLKRIDGVRVKNYTKTVFLTDNKTKLILNVRTHSDHRSETLDFIPLVRELKNCLSCILADKGYDSKANRRYCWDNGIEVHIPVREWKQHRQGFGLKPFLKSKYRKKAAKLFDKNKYNYRSLIESVNSAIKRTLGSYVCSRRADNQQKQVTIKAIAYNLEQIGRTIKLWLFIYC